jgi:rRNA maturation endonuclease Nob1
MTDDPHTRIRVLDTSSLLHLRYAFRRGEERDEALALLAEEVAAKHLFFPPQVKQEIEFGEREPRRVGVTIPPPSEYLQWIRDACSAGAERRPDDDIVSATVKLVPQLVDIASEREEADPYVLALAVELQAEGRPITVITDDIRDKGSLISLASACGGLDIPSVRVAQLIARLKRR